MPWHRLRMKRTVGIEGTQGKDGEREETDATAPQSLSRPRSRMRTIFRRKKAPSNASSYNHFASSVRASPETDVADVEAVSKSDDWSTTIIVLAAGLLLASCFALSPDIAFRVILFGQMLLCTFPVFLANWVLLIPIFLPMKVHSRMEVVLGLGMLSWLGSLDWAFAWKSIQVWFNHDRDIPNQYPES